MDNITGGGADDMRAEDAIRGGVGENLHEPLGLEDGFGTGIAHEGEFADLVGAALRLQLLLGCPHAGDFRGCVYHAGDYPVVNMAVLACEDFGDGHAFVFGFVGQHWACDCITYGV